MNSAGVSPSSVVQAWQFGVEIAGFSSAFFHKAAFPEIEFDESKFSPAGSMFDQKVAGRAKFNDVTLEKMTPQEQTETSILTWARSCITVAAATGGVPSDYLRDVDLIKYDRSGNEIQRYRLFSAFIKTAKFGEGDGGSSENMIETMTLCYNYFDKV